jgi:putative SOS response-associated peptidase YedK
MCYYNSVNITKASSVTLEGITRPLPAGPLLQQPMISGFDHGLCPVLKKIPEQKDFSLAAMEWGFLPSYLKTRMEADRFRKGYKDEKGEFHTPINTLNAIGEEVLLPRKIYRKAALERRCLVLSSGFYEWRHHFGINKRTGAPLKTAGKYPYYIHCKDREFFFMAGIWQPWQDIETGEYAETFSIITTAANPLLAKVHNSKKRMPCILDEVRAAEWLLGQPDEARITELAGYQLPDINLNAYTIAKDFRESDDPMAPYDYAELPGLFS